VTTGLLTERLKAGTHGLHGAAERAGIMNALLNGRIVDADYCLLLRNLHALYAALEHALDAHAQLPQVSPLRMPVLYRAASLRADLLTLHGSGWPRLPLAPAMHGYVARIDDVARHWPWLLGAHAYVRYLGDLNGGQMLEGIVRKALPRGDGAGTSFYAFGSPAEVAALRRRLHTALDTLPLSTAESAEVVAEAQDSFSRHIRMFEELDPPRDRDP